MIKSELKLATYETIALLYLLFKDSFTCVFLNIGSHRKLKKILKNNF